jgi:tetratricopeptide (TPR) repeat protein
MGKRNKRREPGLPAGRASKPPETKSTSVKNRYAIVALLFALALVAYLPAMRGEFIWDDDGHVTKSELRLVAGLCRIWFEVGATQQYYPLLHTAFWLEHKLWGDHTLGYHIVNVLQHSIAACLVYFILVRLKIPGAVLAAAIFAVHPIEVESVAWITEQKNTLSAIFYLSAMRVYFEFDERRQWVYYAIAFTLFVLGLLTKTVTATLPAAIPVIFWWQRGSINWKRDVLPLVPFFALGAVAGIVTAWIERTLIGAQGAPFEMSFLERCLLAGRAIWFYFFKLLWPSNLVFVYPRWQIDAAAWWQWMFPAAAVVMTVLLWTIRHRWRAPLAGWLYFVGTLFPVLGFLNVFPFIYSFVADHFQYLAGLGVIVPTAAWLATTVNRLQASVRWTGQVACSVMVAVLAVCSMHQSAMYGNVVKLYETTIERNPTCWLAYNNLGAYLSFHEHEAKAEPLFREAVRLRPDYAEALMNLGVRMAKTGQPEQAIDLFKRALAARPDFYQAELSWGNALIDMKRPQEAIEHYRAAARLDPKAAMPQYNWGNTLLNLGDTPGAIEHYRSSLQLKPDFVEAHFNLGIVFARAGRFAEAVEQFRSAVELRPEYVDAHYNLGLALVALQRDTEAVEEFREVLRLDPKHITAQPELAKAYARLKRPADAIATAKEASASARAAGDIELANQIDDWLTKYRTQQKAGGLPLPKP